MPQESLETQVALLRQEVKHLQQYIAERDQRVLGQVNEIDRKHSKKFDQLHEWLIPWRADINKSLEKLIQAQSVRRAYIVAWGTLIGGASWLIAQFIAIKTLLQNGSGPG